MPSQGYSYTTARARKGGSDKEKDEERAKEEVQRLKMKRTGMGAAWRCSPAPGTLHPRAWTLQRHGLTLSGLCLALSARGVRGEVQWRGLKKIEVGHCRMWLSPKSASRRRHFPARQAARRTSLFCGSRNVARRDPRSTKKPDRKSYAGSSKQEEQEGGHRG